MEFARVTRVIEVIPVETFDLPELAPYRTMQWQYEHRKEGIFEVKSFHLEPGVIVDDALVTAVKQALQACAAWHQTPQVIIRDTTESGLADIFRVN